MGAKVPAGVKVYLPGSRKALRKGDEVPVDQSLIKQKLDDKINKASETFNKNSSKGVAGKKKSSDMLREKVSKRIQDEIEMSAALKKRGKSVEPKKEEKPANSSASNTSSSK